jgi:hypothetical protein
MIDYRLPPAHKEAVQRLLEEHVTHAASVSQALTQS